MFDADRVRDIARTGLEADPEAGAALCVIVDGQEVIDDQWGLADAARGTPYDGRSLQYPMSAFKGVVGAVLALLIDRGLLDPDQRVAHYWPEFGTAAKRDITVEQLLSHQAGIPFVDGGHSIAALNDRNGFAARLAAQEPSWAPGTAFGYHCWTFGNYADVLIEKASGRGLDGWFGELRDLLGIDVYLGLPRELWDRAVRLLFLPDEVGEKMMRDMMDALEPGSLAWKLMNSFPESVKADALYNGEAIRLMPSAADNSFTDARSLARLYSFLLAGGVWQGQRLCSADAIDTVVRERVRGTDTVIGMEMAFGLAMQHPSGGYPFSPNPAAFGHAGAGGAIAFADPAAGLAMAWLPTRYALEHPEPLSTRIIDAIYEEIGRGN